MKKWAPVPEEPLEYRWTGVEEEDEEAERDEDGLPHRDEAVEGALPTSHPLQRVHLDALRHETPTGTESGTNFVVNFGDEKHLSVAYITACIWLEAFATLTSLPRPQTILLKALKVSQFHIKTVLTLIHLKVILLT